MLAPPIPASSGRGYSARGADRHPFPSPYRRANPPAVGGTGGFHAMADLQLIFASALYDRMQATLHRWVSRTASISTSSASTATPHLRPHVGRRGVRHHRVFQLQFVQRSPTSSAPSSPSRCSRRTAPPLPHRHQQEASSASRKTSRASGSAFRSPPSPPRSSSAVAAAQSRCRPRERHLGPGRDQRQGCAGSPIVLPLLKPVEITKGRPASRWTT